MSPGLDERADCIVWFPDDFQPPPEPVREWLERWLADQPGRTLIYVGRDFDAAPFYWKTIQADAPQDQRAEIARRLTAARVDYQTARKNLPKDERCDWFAYDSQPPARQVRTLQGDPDWLEGIDPAKLEIELGCRLVPVTDMEVLLESEGDALVTIQQSDGSQLIVVTNGSFLLNLPLVNREHRKLAGKLIEQVGEPGQMVVFLESGPHGPSIRQDDASQGPPTGLEVFNLWPTNWILLHLAIVGILFCFSRYPIFGRARELEPENTADFGKHVQAMADLLEKTRDSGYAMSRVLHYQQTVHSGAGKGDSPFVAERSDGDLASKDPDAAQGDSPMSAGRKPGPSPTDTPFSPSPVPREDER